MLAELGKETERRCLQLENALSPMEVTESGIDTEVMSQP
jgi:hypothetical protein